MVVAKLYTPEWNFVRSCEGFTEVEAISKIDPDFKGHAILYQYGKLVAKYEFK